MSAMVMIFDCTGISGDFLPWGYPDPPTLGAVRDYIHLDQRSELVDAPPGRPVYCTGQQACPQLEEAGVVLEPVAGDLFAVRGFESEMELGR